MTLELPPREGLSFLEQSPLKEKKRPTPTFHGWLARPEDIGALPDGKSTIATFNAAVISVPNQKTGQIELLATFRVQDDNHEGDKADRTKYFGSKRIEFDSEGKIVPTPTTFVKADSVISPHDAETGKNPEDTRLNCDKDHGVYGGLTEAVEITRQELYELEGIPYNPGEENLPTTIPLVATIFGQPTFDENGSVDGIDFQQASLAMELRDGETQARPIVGKNAWVEYNIDGEQLLRCRPEYIRQADGTVVVNQTHVRTFKLGEDGYYHQYAEDGIYNTDQETLAEILPEGHTLLKFGLNGRTIHSATGDFPDFRIDHVACQRTEDNTVEYAFITVDGRIKPLLSYAEAVALAPVGSVEEDLTGTKRVIYCNGYAVVGNRLVMAVTYSDKQIGIISYDLKELADYATDGKESNILEVNFPTHRRTSAVKINAGGENESVQK